MSHYISPVRPGRLPPWLIALVFLSIVGLSWWQTRLQPGGQQAGPVKSNSTGTSSIYERDDLPAIRPIDVQVAEEPNTDSHPDVVITPQHAGSTKKTRSTESQDSATAKSNRTRIENQTIHDQSGRVVFQGTIDLQPTLDRIAKGQQNSHRNDGTTFQNRERRLPAKPSGYYKEYVHPTPNISGPGPQRVIIGKDGDIWYTPDHYQTFRRIPSE